MNNQMPYNFMSGQFGNNSCHCTNEIRILNERIDSLEKQIRRLERKINNLENSSMFVKPVPLSNSFGANNQGNNIENQFPNNYMI